MINQLRAVLLERGIVVAKGRRQLETFLVTMLADGAEPPTTLSSRTRLLIEDMCLEWGELDRRIAALTAEFVARAREDRAARRLATIPRRLAAGLGFSGSPSEAIPTCARS